LPSKRRNELTRFASNKQQAGAPKHYMILISLFPAHSNIPSMATHTNDDMLHFKHSLLFAFSTLDDALISRNAGPHDIQTIITILCPHVKVYVL
jgi:hypothetical protein